MVNASQIQEHMEIKGSDGQHVGTVDRVEGDRIKLTNPTRLRVASTITWTWQQCGK